MRSLAGSGALAAASLLAGLLFAADRNGPLPGVWRATAEAAVVAAHPTDIEEAAWQRLPDGAPLLLDAGRHWLRVAIPAAGSDGHHLLTLSRAPLRARLWLPPADGAGGGYETQIRDVLSPHPERYAPQALGFDLPARGVDVRVFLEIEAEQRVVLALALEPLPQFYRDAGRWTGIIGAALSALAVMGLMNLLFWLRLRDRLYLLFLLFIVVQVGWGLYVSGLAPAWLDLLAGLDARGSPGPALLMGSLALLLGFARGFLVGQRPPERLRRSHSAAITLTSGLALIHLLPGAGDSLLLSGTTVAALLLVPAVLLWMALAHLRAGGARSWPLLAGLVPLALALWALAGVLLGRLPPSMLVQVGPLPAAAFLAVMLAIALAGRVLELRVQRDLALRLAETDAMTGLLNRRGGMERLKAMFRHCRETRSPLSVLFIDLDELKPINDRLGHEAGDACLLALSRVLSEHLPAGAALSRWGGDEFVMLLPGFDTAAGVRLAEDIARNWSATPVRYGGRTLRLTASLGLAGLDSSDETPQSLLLRADAAVYRAKYGGRNRVETSEAGAVSADFTRASTARAPAGGR